VRKRRSVVSIVFGVGRSFGAGEREGDYPTSVGPALSCQANDLLHVAYAIRKCETIRTPANFRPVYTPRTFTLQHLQRLNSVPLLLCRTEDALGFLQFALLTSNSALTVDVESIFGLDLRRMQARPFASWAEASAMQPMHLAATVNVYRNGTGYDSSSLAV